MKNGNVMSWGFGIVILSGIICFALSMNNPRFNQMGLGGLFNIVLPFLSTLISVIIYWGLTVAFEKKNWLIISIIVSIINIIYGIYLHLNP